MNSLEKKIVFLLLIAGRKQKKELAAEMSKCGVQLVNLMYGKGTVKAGILQNMLGLVPEENKIVITGLMAEEKTDAVFETLVSKFDFDKPNTGIAFTMPVDGLSYK